MNVALEEAAKLLNRMNVQVEPCDDFYSYACGNFVRNTEFKGNKEYVTTTSLMQDRIDERLNELLSSPIKADDVGAYEAAKLLYDTCKQTENETSKITHLIEILDALGGFPILKANFWNSQTFYWPDILKKLNSLGFSSDFLTELNIMPSKKDFDIYGGTFILSLTAPKTILTKEKFSHIRKKEEIDRYKMYITNVIKKLNNISSPENISKDINDIVDFESKLVRLAANGHEMEHTQKLAIRDLKQQFPTVDWMKFINSFLPDEISITENETVIVSNSHYLHDLQLLLTVTSNRTLANYLLWRVVDFSISYSSNNFQTLHNQYHIVKKYETCVELVRHEMPLICSSMYARAYLNNRNKDVLRDQIVDDVEGLLEFVIDILTWLDETSRGLAQKGIKETIRFITVPQELSNDYFGRYYSKLPFKKTALLDQILNLRKFQQDNMFSKLKMIVQPHEWTRFADLVNIIDYKPSERYVLSIPASLIEEQLMHLNTTVIDYATVGVVVARDFIYRFMGLYDPVGTTFKSHGEWWTEKSLDNFKPHLECFVNAYGKFQTPDGIKLRSNYLKYENIVDVGALRAAYSAFKFLGDTSDERLPGIQYNDQKQIFWTKAAQNWCSKYTPDSLKRALIRGNEVPGKFRVNGAIMHLRDFGKDFNCKVGTYMFPDNDSCYKLWDSENFSLSK